MNSRLESNIGQRFIAFQSRGKNAMTSHRQCIYIDYRPSFKPPNWKDQSGKANIMLHHKEKNG